MARHEFSAIVSRWPIRDARPVTPVLTINAPSDASNVYAL
jgi:hypothetical protein